MKTQIIFLIVLVILAVTNESKQKRRKWCTFNELYLKCNSYLRTFTSRENSTGIAYDERKLDYYCAYQLKLFPECTRKWFQRCGNELWMQFNEEIIINQYVNRFGSMCSGPTRDKFLKYAPCLHFNVKPSKSYREECVKNIQAGFEFIQQKYYNASITNKLRSICCVYNRWENCITSHLLDKCGPVSDEIIVDLIRSSSIDIMMQICPMDIYHPNSRICADVWQPEDMTPKGLTSNSYFSYMFSYWCPNVGYGILPERD